MPRARVRRANGRRRVKVAQQCDNTGDSDDQANIQRLLGEYPTFPGGDAEVLAEMQEMMQLQRENKSELASLNTNVRAIVGVLQEISTTLNRAFPPVPPCVPGTSAQTTSLAGTGRAVLRQLVSPAGTLDTAVADPTSGRKHGRPPKNAGIADGKEPTASTAHRT